MSRRVDRRHVFCLTFQLGFLTDAKTDAIFDSYVENHMDEPDDSQAEKAFILKAFSGVYENLEKIDATISRALKSWTFDRLNKADIALLRLGIYEMMYDNEIPASVAINEAVELAKIYCDDNAPASINAILGQILRGEDADKATTDAPSEDEKS